MIVKILSYFKYNKYILLGAVSLAWDLSINHCYFRPEVSDLGALALFTLQLHVPFLPSHR